MAVVTSRLSAAEAVCSTLSCTWTVKLYRPMTVDVPEIVPVDPNVNPAGRAPEITLHWYGGVPPVAYRLP